MQTDTKTICVKNIIHNEESGAPNEGVPQNICSAVEIQLAGKLLIFTHFRWETVNISGVSIRAG